MVSLLRTSSMNVCCTTSSDSAAVKPHCRAVCQSNGLTSRTSRSIAPGTPWSDIDRIGDSYKSNEWVDNVLVTWDGWLGRAAKLYANGESLKNPYISPIYGDFKGFPPTILTTGTRDLFLSNTVRTHRKLRRAGVVADLNVYEGQSHAQYQFNINAPETREAFTDIAKFFDRHLDE